MFGCSSCSPTYHSGCRVEVGFKERAISRYPKNMTPGTGSEEYSVHKRAQFNFASGKEMKHASIHCSGLIAT